MGECTHPRSQGYTDDLDRSRCGACGDVWDNDRKMFVPLRTVEGPDAPEGKIVGLEPYIRPTVIIVDVRNGKIREDGFNIDLPSEGQVSFLESLARTDVIVEVHDDNVWVKRGFDKHIVLLGRTKSEAQMSGEKADREKAARAVGAEQPTGMTGDRGTFEDDPVDNKFKRVWDGSVPSGEPVKGGLKGY
jgi:hypothetical protein